MNLRDTSITQLSPARHPSYQSVAIFFYDKPNDDLLKLMVNRIYEFCKNTLYSPTIKILDIKLSQTIITHKILKHLSK